MIEILHAEWLKVRTVRSTYWVLLALAGFVGLAAWVSWYGATTPGAIPSEHRDAFALRVQARMTADVAGLCGAVLAVIAITSEYTTGTIHPTFTAMPRRAAVLISKAFVTAAVAGVAGLLSVFATYVTTRAILDARPVPGQSLPPVADEVMPLLALGLSVVTYTLIGLGLATVMRSAAAAIATFVGLWYLVPMVGANLPAPWGERISSVLPGALAGQLASIGNELSVYGALLSPLGAASVMIGYMVIPLGAATLVLVRRDT
jgi:ABC-2 type transport system permease protein